MYIYLSPGKFVTHTAQIILFIVRTVVRVESYMLFLINHYNWSTNTNSSNNHNGSMANSYIRGLNVSYNTYTNLSKASQVLRTVLLKHVYPMLSR